MISIVLPNFTGGEHKVLKEFENKDEQKALMEFRKDKYNYCAFFYEKESKFKKLFKCIKYEKVKKTKNNRDTHRV